MGPDLHASGDVGLIPAIILLIIFCWGNSLRKRKGTDSEEKLFDIFIIIGVQILLYPLYFLVGAGILAGLYFASPLINTIFNIDVKEMITTHVWVDGSFAGFLWSGVVGAMFMNLGWVIDFFNKPINKPIGDHSDSLPRKKSQIKNVGKTTNGEQNKPEPPILPKKEVSGYEVKTKDEKVRERKKKETEWEEVAFSDTEESLKMMKGGGGNEQEEDFNKDVKLYDYYEGTLRYEGEIKNGYSIGERLEGTYHGHGKEYSPLGHLKYEGEFKDGAYHGKGKRSINGDLIYEGEWEVGKFHGHGKKYDGELVYEGEFENGIKKKEGQCKQL